MTLDRRTVLVRGLWGGLLLAAGGSTFLALRPSARVELPPEPLHALSPAHFAILLAVVTRCVPPPASTPATCRDTVVRLDTTLAQADARTRNDLLRLLGLLDNALAGFLLDGESTPFSRLDAAAQDAVLERWRLSRFALRRTGYQALRRLAATHFYADPAAQRAIGYPGPPVGVQ
ncbi:hypothetical protein L6V77_02590 [Myxococcota bacterium]|jgi:hypothetical protein|nr:hypothetical protein [Myxococcota bacterium]